MKVINAFIDPILDDALGMEKNRKAALLEKQKNGEGIANQTEDQLPEEMQTLLGHLVSMTDGAFIFVSVPEVCILNPSHSRQKVDPR